MTLTFHLRNAYGHERYYPVNTQAQAVCAVARRVCLDVGDIERLRLVGFSIKVSVS